MNTSIKAAHTPGPWSPFYNDEDGRHLLNKQDVIVCEHIHTGEDARLIAAAPEMLEALKEIIRVNLDERMHPRTRRSLSVQAAEAAIQKARGEHGR